VLSYLLKNISDIYFNEPTIQGVKIVEDKNENVFHEKQQKLCLEHAAGFI
jgi:hypothetical protein